MQALSPSPARPSRREDGAPSGWDRYLDLLTRKQVPEQARRWYVARVEAFLKELRPTSLAKLTKEQITGYFQQASSGGQFAEWQFRQLVDAIGLLIVDLAQAPAGKAVDWDYWKEAGKSLSAEHPTIARGQPSGPEATASGPRFSRSAQRFPILEDLARTIRARHYSIRTEQSYVDWCRRLLLFCEDRPLDLLTPEDVQRFLTHLAVDLPSGAGYANRDG